MPISATALSVTQRGSSWQASVSHKGKRWRKDFPTKADALVWEAETKAAILRGETPNEGGGKAGRHFCTPLDKPGYR